ncbi:DUF4160 domain-containing protein [Vogesella indigofera]|uniref:DUF4160 domain-containing protein n=1 Tax=Vogesella indigofera TaxID=45465 RepID=UPI00234F9370|nr:DUF4160 domain-containing protein [Vogesella indigofera]MDC7696891.1 DUF4160 domain-containing protein [Vogesella indigofera]
MALEKEFGDLQYLFAQKDLLTKPKAYSSSRGARVELLLIKRKYLKYKIYQERGHAMPHIHIDYGCNNHVASYAIETGERIEGNLDRKYEVDVSNWLSKNKEQLIKIWYALQSGEDTEALIGELQGDA